MFHFFKLAVAMCVLNGFIPFLFLFTNAKDIFNNGQSLWRQIHPNQMQNWFHFFEFLSHPHSPSLRERERKRIRENEIVWKTLVSVFWLLLTSSTFIFSISTSFSHSFFHDLSSPQVASVITMQIRSIRKCKNTFLPFPFWLFFENISKLSFWRHLRVEIEPSRDEAQKVSMRHRTHSHAMYSLWCTYVKGRTQRIAYSLLFSRLLLLLLKPFLLLLLVHNTEAAWKSFESAASIRLWDVKAAAKTERGREKERKGEEKRERERQRERKRRSKKEKKRSSCQTFFFMTRFFPLFSLSFIL